MADTTSTTSAINPPSSSLKLYYRVARFAWQSGEHYLGLTSDYYFRLPSSHIYETCENFLCWETEWIALPAHRSAAEAASISIFSSGELCSGEVAANERSESATGPKLSYTHTTNHTESATPLSSASTSTSHTYGVNDESATGSPVPAEDTCADIVLSPGYLNNAAGELAEKAAEASFLMWEIEAENRAIEDERSAADLAAWEAEEKIRLQATRYVIEVLARIEAALPSPANYEWFYIYRDDRLTIDAWYKLLAAVGVVDNYGDVINLPRNAYLQHFTYTH